MLIGLKGSKSILTFFSLPSSVTMVPQYTTKPLGGTGKVKKAKSHEFKKKRHCTKAPFQGKVKNGFLCGATLNVKRVVSADLYSVTFFDQRDQCNSLYKRVTMCTKIRLHKRDELNSFLSLSTKMQLCSMVLTAYRRIQLHANYFIHSDQ